MAANTLMLIYVRSNLKLHGIFFFKLTFIYSTTFWYYIIWSFESVAIPRCFDIDATMIQRMITDQVMCIIVENMAFVVNEMRDLLKIRAITSNIQEIQPKSERIIIKPAVKL